MSQYKKISFNDMRDIINYSYLSSEIEKDNSLKGQDKILEICNKLGADTYYNAIGGLELYNKDDFDALCIKLKFLQSEITPYNQFKNDFVGGLSIIDILMFNSPNEVNKMLKQFTLL